MIEGRDEQGEREKQKRGEPDQPPVDGPSAGSEGEEDDKDLSDSSYDSPGK